LKPRRAANAGLGCGAALAVVCAGACGNTTLDLYDPDLGLLAHWAFEEGQAGSVVLDSSGFGLHGTPSASPPAPTADVPPVHFPNSFSLSFNGVDQWIDLGNPPLLNAGGAISIAAWVRATNVDGYRNIVAHGWRHNPGADVSLRIQNGNYEFTYWDAVDHVAIAAVPAADVGAWVHVCGVFDGSAYHLYRNGALAASRSDATVPPANIDAVWAIGARAPQPDLLERLFAGGIDDVRIYGRALGPPEVEALYRR
jgi:hypothetical protein